MLASQRGDLGGKVTVERRLDGGALAEVLVQFQYDVTAGGGRLDGNAEPLGVGDELLPGRVGTHLLTQRLRQCLVDGDDSPRCGQVELVTLCLPINPADHRRAQCCGGSTTNHLGSEFTHLGIITICLVCLEHGELRVVGGVGPFIAEIASDLEHPAHTADHESLEVQLRGDTQVQISVVGIDVGAERPGIRPAVNGLQDRGLDLEEVMGEQGLPYCPNRPGPCHELIARTRVDDEVEVAASHLGLGVRETVTPVGQWAQRLGRDLPVLGQQARRAIA